MQVRLLFALLVAMSATCCTTFSTSAQAALVAGDLAFVGFNADGDSDFAVVILADIVNETVYFTDNEPVGTTGEGTIQWNTGVISAGTVVVFTDIDSVSNPSFGVSTGVLTYPDAGLNLAVGGDGLYAFQGTDFATPSTFIAAIANDDFGVSSTGDLTLTGLTEGTNAIEFSTTNHDGGIYNGSRTSESNFADYLALINNPLNWTSSSTDGESFVPFSTLSFTTVAVPEPSSLIALACGGAVTFTRRRR